MHQNVKISRGDYGILGIIFSLVIFFCTVVIPFVRVNLFFKEADMTFIEYLDVSAKDDTFVLFFFLLMTQLAVAISRIIVKKLFEQFFYGIIGLYSAFFLAGLIVKFIISFSVTDGFELHMGGMLVLIFLTGSCLLELANFCYFYRWYPLQTLCWGISPIFFVEVYGQMLEADFAPWAVVAICLALIVVGGILLLKYHAQWNSYLRKRIAAKSDNDADNQENEVQISETVVKEDSQGDGSVQNNPVPEAATSASTITTTSDVVAPETPAPAPTPAPVAVSPVAETVTKKSPATPAKKTNTGLIVGIVVGLLVLIGGVAGYFVWYVPYAKDRDALRTYVMATNVFLRSSEMAGVEYNVLGKIPYGSELITYEKGEEWAHVKVNGTEGYMASSYLLEGADFTLLNSVWGDMDSRDCIESSKCRMAILDFYKQNKLTGGSSGWQIYTKTKNQKPNTVFYPRIYDKGSKFTDFFFVVKNNASGQRTLVGYSFEDETEKPIYRFMIEAPEDGYIQKVYSRGGNVVVQFDNYQNVTVPLYR